MTSLKSSNIASKYSNNLRFAGYYRIISFVIKSYI